MHKIVHSDEAPKAIGCYSQAIIANKIIFVSGQIPLDPVTMKVEGDIKEQTKQVLKNLFNILKEAGAQAQSVVKTTVYLKDLQDFSSVNEEYEKFFSEHKPARVCIEVSRLPRDSLVEIDAIAVI
jgi:2-iminobutanoate/2-iminopropanoate deaminase